MPSELLSLSFPAEVTRVVHSLKLESGAWILCDEFENRVWYLEQGCEPRFIDAPDQFHYPCGVTQANDEIFIVDSWHHRVCVFNLKGQFLRSFGSYGFDDHSFACPEGIACDENGLLWIADVQNDRIVAYSTAGERIDSIEKSAFFPNESFLVETPQGVKNHAMISTVSPRQLRFSKGGTLVVKTNERLLFFKEKSCVAAFEIDGLICMHIQAFEGDQVTLFDERDGTVWMVSPNYPGLFRVDQRRKGECFPYQDNGSLFWVGVAGIRDFRVESSLVKLSPEKVFQECQLYLRMSRSVYDTHTETFGKKKPLEEMTLTLWPALNSLLEQIAKSSKAMRKPTKSGLAAAFPLHLELPNYIFEAEAIALKVQWQNLFMRFASNFKILLEQGDCENDLNDIQARVLAEYLHYYNRLVAGKEGEDTLILNADICLTWLLQLLLLLNQIDGLKPTLQIRDIQQRVLNHASISEQVNLANFPALAIPETLLDILKAQASAIFHHLVAAAKMDFQSTESQTTKSARAIQSQYLALWLQQRKGASGLEPCIAIAMNGSHLIFSCYFLGFKDIAEQYIAAFSCNPLRDGNAVELHKANYLIRVGQHKEAIKHLEEGSSQIKTTNPKPFLVETYARFGFLEKAKSLMTSLSGIELRKAQIVFSLTGQDLEGQLALLIKEAEAANQPTLAHRWVGLFFLRLNRFSEGLSWMEANRTHLQQPKNIDLTGLLAWFSGDLAKAQQYFEESKRLSCKNALLLAGLLRAQGRVHAALEELDGVKAAIPMWPVEISYMVCDLHEDNQAAYEKRKAELPEIASFYLGEKWIHPHHSQFDLAMKQMMEIEKQGTQLLPFAQANPVQFWSYLHFLTFPAWHLLLEE
jgi:hypothetical protein